MSEVKNFCGRLGIKFDEQLTPFYEEGKALYEKDRNAFTNRERLIKLNREYNIFRRWFDDVLKAAEFVEKDNDLVLFVAVLYCIIKEKMPLSIIEMPDRRRLDTDFAPLFSLLYFVEDIVADLKKRGLPFDVISDTLQGFDAEINDYYGIFGRSGMRIYVSWLLHFVRGEILRIGRLNFQMTTLGNKIRVFRKNEDIKILIDGEYVHENGMLFGSAGQNDECRRYYADITEEKGVVSGFAANAMGECVNERVYLEGYREVLKSGDKIISVHIPSNEPLSHALCEQSYERAEKIFKECYPEFDYKAFYCVSWMMEKKLRDIMGRETNITRFADKYTLFPVLSEGIGVYNFLFHLQEKAEPQTLAEQTSMQRKVKEYLCGGNHFYEKGGVFFVD